MPNRTTMLSRDRESKPHHRRERDLSILQIVDHIRAIHHFYRITDCIEDSEICYNKITGEKQEDQKEEEKILASLDGYIAEKDEMRDMFPCDTSISKLKAKRLGLSSSYDFKKP